MEKITIKIDGKKYELDEKNVTGIQLKSLIKLPLEKSLQLKVKDSPDTEIINDNNYTIHNDMIFYSELYEAEVVIKVDGKEVKVPQECSGKKLKEIIGVPNDNKLIKEEKDEQDLKVEDEIEYELNKNDEFFVVPAGINNGGK